MEGTNKKVHNVLEEICERGSKDRSGRDRLDRVNYLASGFFYAAYGISGVEELPKLIIEHYTGLRYILPRVRLSSNIRKFFPRHFLCGILIEMNKGLAFYDSTYLPQLGTFTLEDDWRSARIVPDGGVSVPENSSSSHKRNALEDRKLKKNLSKIILGSGIRNNLRYSRVKEAVVNDGAFNDLMKSLEREMEPLVPRLYEISMDYVVNGLASGEEVDIDMGVIRARDKNIFLDFTEDTCDFVLANRERMLEWEREKSKRQSLP